MLEMPGRAMQTAGAPSLRARYAPDRFRCGKCAGWWQFRLDPVREGFGWLAGHLEFCVPWKVLIQRVAGALLWSPVNDTVHRAWPAANTSSRTHATNKSKHRATNPQYSYLVTHSATRLVCARAKSLRHFANAQQATPRYLARRKHLLDDVVDGLIAVSTRA